MAKTITITEEVRAKIAAIPHGEYTGTITKVAEACEVAESTVYRWFRHPEQMSLLTKQKVVEILNA